MVGVEAAVEADAPQLEQDLEHVHVAVVEEHLLEAVGRGEGFFRGDVGLGDARDDCFR